MAIVTPWLGHVELADDYFAAVDRRLPGDGLLIVDNGSEPPLEFAHLYSEDNLGFSGGCNVGLRHATADAVLFLNNDIAVVRSHWLEEIREALEPGVIVGPLRDGPHTEVDGQRFPYVDGWCLAAMRKDLLELGGWDETFVEPSYFGDNDLCLRARGAGMTLRDVRVGLRHKENVTAGSAREAQVAEATRLNRDRYVARVRELLVTA